MDSFHKPLDEENHFWSGWIFLNVSLDESIVLQMLFNLEVKVDIFHNYFFLHFILIVIIISYKYLYII